MIGLLRGFGFVLGAGLLLAPGSALAFSDPITFGKPTLAAGGGGHYFTGSPADGYTCKVCHAGGTEPKLSVKGLPLSGYRLGASYEVMVSWQSSDKVSLALELTDDKGQRAGSLQLPDEAEVQIPELCEPADALVPAASLTEIDTRQVISVAECGSKRVRFLWTAPTTDVGRVWFSGAAVSSDAESDTEHDGVTDFGRVIGSPAVASSTNAQCGAVAPGSAHGNSLGIGLLLATLGLCKANRGRRRRDPAADAPS